ncbi:hypothetical protein Emin_0139 [Elusimicrobium minutum Pei191]|uniref:Uncharacterized protein n=1 Tax=Elusimicrobium minutum (strain Pei191) TaxID=445932 RepID=B2KBL8_ELUMP|nr:hypothetical protein [Elusimicrobium minutum]ACC97705.1 hypothetical protein Emin_0139 [Elusimicrobium minutum Pei191]
MQDKIAQLEVLVAQATQKLSGLEGENSTLKNRLRTVEAHLERLREIEDEAKILRDWKRDTLAQLKRLQSKIEKEIKN